MAKRKIVSLCRDKYADIYKDIQKRYIDDIKVQKRTFCYVQPIRQKKRGREPLLKFKKREKMICNNSNKKHLNSLRFHLFEKKHKQFMPMLEESFLKMLFLLTREKAEKNNPIVFTPVDFGSEWYLKITTPVKKTWDMTQPISLETSTCSAKVLSVILMHYAIGDCHCELQKAYKQDVRNEDEKSSEYLCFFRDLEEVRFNLLYNYDSFKFSKKDRQIIFHFTD